MNTKFALPMVVAGSILLAALGAEGCYEAQRGALPRIERPLAGLVLVATGAVVVVFHDGAAFESISGQEWVFEVAAFEREVSNWSQMIQPIRQVRKVRNRGRGLQETG